MQASLLQLTLDTILNEIQKLAPDIDRLMFGGRQQEYHADALLQIKAKHVFLKTRYNRLPRESIRN